MAAPYSFQEGSITPPSDWKDQSMTVFRFAGSGNTGGRDAALVITRDHDAGDDLTGYVNRQHEAFRNQFPGYTPLARNHITLGGLPGYLIDYRWQGPNAVMRQCQAVVRMGTTNLIFTLTAHVDDFERHLPTWNAVLASYRQSGQTPELLETIGPDVARFPAEVLRSYVFALAVASHELYVYADAGYAASRVSPYEVGEGQWLFFASDGTPLEPHVSGQPFRRGIVDGIYTLRSGTDRPGDMLQQHLSFIQTVKGLAPLDSLDTVRAWLIGSAKAERTA
ncbi:DUF1795 domain-containing protein [Paraburkholderia xenovorans]|uniref:DcrB-related protein n=1 Tax=Paraburkholderia xenovorans TaxID=36873 RepID=UPI0038B73595